jgi:hypothetical protein
MDQGTKDTIQLTILFAIVLIGIIFLTALGVIIELSGGCAFFGCDENATSQGLFESIWGCPPGLIIVGLAAGLYWNRRW